MEVYYGMLVFSIAVNRRNRKISSYHSSGFSPPSQVLGFEVWGLGFRGLGFRGLGFRGLGV